LHSPSSLSLALISLLLILGVRGGRVRSGSEVSGEEEELIVFGGYGMIKTGSVCVAISFTNRAGSSFLVSVEVFRWRA